MVAKLRNRHSKTGTICTLRNPLKTALSKLTVRVYGHRCLRKESRPPRKS